jgi:hypothetical protein
MSEDINKTLAARGARYGKFADHAACTQKIKDTMRAHDIARLAPDQREALEMIVHKIGRILCGDPDYHDSWHDIVGYAKLVADRLAPATEVAHAGAVSSVEHSRQLSPREEEIDYVTDLQHAMRVGEQQEVRWQAELFMLKRIADGWWEALHGIYAGTGGTARDALNSALRILLSHEYEQ